MFAGCRAPVRTARPVNSKAHPNRPEKATLHTLHERHQCYKLLQHPQHDHLSQENTFKGDTLNP
jgi:hypothetical protein